MIIRSSDRGNGAHDIRVRYYHPSTHVTVCLMRAGDDTARGISICSLTEPANAAKGRIKAKGRAVQALARRQDVDPIVRSEALRALGDLQFIFGGMSKAAFNPKLFPMEAALINY